MYRKMGLWTLPCVPNGKAPLIQFAEVGQMTDDDVTRHWSKEPDANVAVRTGREQSLFVIDLDIDEAKGANGWAAFGQLCAEFGEVAPTPIQVTGGGGRQLFFNWPPDLNRIPTRAAIRFRGDRMVGFDVRGSGAYAVVPPSVHPNGERYRWLDEFGPHEVELAFAPVWLLKIVIAEHRPMVKSVSIPKMKGPRANYAHKALVNVLSTILDAVEGERNQRFFNAACRLFELHKVGLYSDRYDDLTEKLIAAALASRNPLEAKEIGQSLYSAERRIFRNAHSYDRRRQLIRQAGGNYEEAITSLRQDLRVA